MKKTLILLTVVFLGSGVSVAFAGENGGQADRYNEARSYPNKSIDERTSKEIIDDREAVENLEKEHQILKKLISDLMEKF
ncbi:hypothetical protein [Marinobacter fonticola]|uniref:hypothetical protein n=1 Tax=Marinobacter fonticola TaxID=2603215 RepID=UPI0011E83DF4|nr:hypothetical protein [Marinobacter fonticola]